MDIVVPQGFSEVDSKSADVARSAYRRSAYTSRASNVLDMADVRKTVCLCPDHDKAFATPEVLSKYGYREMPRFPHAMADCDYCGDFTKCRVFTHESVFSDVWITKEDRRREIDACIRVTA